MSAAILGLGGVRPDAMRTDYEQARRRTRWTMSTSAVAHVLLLLWLVLLKPAIENQPAFTEITLLEPGDLAPAAAPGSPARAVDDVKGLPRPRAMDERFARARTDAEIAPEPQMATAFEDRIAARLASLQQNQPMPVRGIAVAGAPSGMLAAPAGVTGGRGTGGTSPLSLARGGGTGSGPALPLTRGGGTGVGPAVVTTGLPSEASAAAAPARGGESSARRSLAGALLMGPVADRPVLHTVTPAYPEWAKRDAVEGSVTIYFVVRPDGSIKENVLVQKTAGFEDFDENARSALKAWRFQPLTGGRTGEQWGTITFHFRLREAG